MDVQQVMVFTDGENLCIRGQKVLKDSGIPPVEGRFYSPDSFVWMDYPSEYHRPKGILGDLSSLTPAPYQIVRSSYYTSVCGDSDAITAVREKIWHHQLTPQVFKKVRKDQKAKGVDIALTKDMLIHAFHGHYDTAVLVAGDGDYVPLVEEVKRFGRRVVLHFFQEGLNNELRLACDAFFDLTSGFKRYWSEWRDPQTEQARFPMR
jgi:uncharacterized LabA/DUF88 family protein